MLDEIDQRAADADDPEHIKGLVAGVIGLGAFGDGMGIGLLRIDDAPAHRRRAGAMLGHEVRGVAARLGVDDIGDVALLPKLDGFGLVPRGQDVAHLGKEIAQGLRLGMGEFDEFEAVGADGVLL